jgi:hypothetical protein
MSNTYTWAVNALTCYPTYESETDVVFTVRWTCTASSGNFLSNITSVTYVEWVSGSPFTPYSQLTQDQVIGWVQSALGAEQIAEIYSKLDFQIEQQMNPPVVTPPLPWAGA